MDVALKIWRFDPDTGERVLRDYEVEAPEWACLLDVLDIVKDQVDGSLSYRKSCRMMICGSCGMRMDGRAVLACKERMKPIVDRGHVPVIAAMGNMPVLKDLVVDRGELLGLTWEAVDLDEGRLWVRQTLAWVDGRRRIQPPKTRASRRVVPLPSVVVAALRAHRELRPL